MGSGLRVRTTASGFWGEHRGFGLRGVGVQGFRGLRDDLSVKALCGEGGARRVPAPGLTPQTQGFERVELDLGFMHRTPGSRLWATTILTCNLLGDALCRIRRRRLSLFPVSASSDLQSPGRTSCPRSGGRNVRFGFTV